MTINSLPASLHSRQSLLGTLLLGIAGIAINFLPIEIFPGIHFVFGSIFSIIAAARFGPVAGGAVGLMAGLRTWWLWQQPFPSSAIIYSLEGFWVGYALKKGRKRILTSVLLYWLLVGAWINLAAQLFIIGFPPATAVLIQTRSVVNGLLAGLVVEIGWATVEVARSKMRRCSPRLTLESVIALLLTTVITLPLVLMSVRSIKDEQDRYLEHWDATAQSDILYVKENVSTLLDSYSRGVATAASLVDGRALSDRQYLQEVLSVVREKYPEFAGMYIADASAKTVAFDPQINSAGQQLVGLSFSDRQYYRDLMATKSTVYSGVYLARGGMSAPAVAIGVPLIDSSNQVKGFALGWFDINRFSNIFRRYHQPDSEMVIVDKEGHLINSSSYPDGSYTKVLDLAGSKEYRLMQSAEQGSGYLTESELRPVLPSNVFLRDGDHLRFETVAGSGWKVWYRQSLTPLKQQISRVYLTNLLILALMLVVAHFLSKAVARLLTLPLGALERKAHEVAAGELENKIVAQGLVTAETGSLFASFNRMAGSLSVTMQKLQHSEERFRSAFDYAAVGIALVDMEGQLAEVNPAFGQITGFSESELLEMNFQSLTHPDDLSRTVEEIRLLKAGKIPSFQIEKRYLHKHGHLVWVHLSASITIGSLDMASRLIFQIQDITDRKRAEERLLHDAFHDGLTGLPNRALFLDHLRLALEHTKRRIERRFAVLFLDLDRFKIINDSLGHLAGDQFLIEVARRLQEGLRVGDTVARLGGDEFTILLEDVSGLEEVTEITDRIQCEISRPFAVKGKEVFPAASIGIALGNAEYHSPEELLRDADTAMYKAKSQGTGRREVFDHSMHSSAINRLHMECDLRRAIEREEFVIHYQPLVSLKTGHLAGFEALVRWQHPQEGLIPPLTFIPIAEETGMIIPLGEWVIRESCRTMRRWIDEFMPAGKLLMSVNLSGKQFAQPSLADKIRSILDETGLEPKNLKLELTESVVMDNVEAAINTLRQLRALGVEISVDDFGTGYSSLSYLHKFPLTTLKVDRSFIRNLDGSEENSEIVRTVVLLARALKMEVIAEGVETASQAQHLKGLGCDYGQGFFFAYPLDREMAEAIIMSDHQWDVWNLEDEMSLITEDLLELESALTK